MSSPVLLTGRVFFRTPGGQEALFSYGWPYFPLHVTMSMHVLLFYFFLKYLFQFSFISISQWLVEFTCLLHAPSYSTISPDCEQMSTTSNRNWKM